MRQFAKLRVDDEAICKAEGWRWGNLYGRGLSSSGQSLHYSCVFLCFNGFGWWVSQYGLLNDIFCQALVRAGLPSSKEPVRLLRSHGKHPDGATFMGVTLVGTLLKAHLPYSTSTAGVETKLANQRNVSKYESMPNSYHFVPLALRNLVRSITKNRS